MLGLVPGVGLEPTSIAIKECLTSRYRVHEDGEVGGIKGEHGIYGAQRD